MISHELLRLENISYTYGEAVPALEGVSVSISAGERIAVLGSNGAGKSTFFFCCNGVLSPQSGEVFLCGQKVSNRGKDIFRLREAVGMVFQDPDDQIIASTVESEISFGPMNLKLDRTEVVRRVDGAVGAMALQALRSRPPHYLSGGEKKLVTIADILAMEPQIILFDEPTSSLDPQNTSRFKRILEDLSSLGMTFMVSTHDIDFAWEWAERVLVFHDGKLLADAEPTEAFGDEALLAKAGLRKPLLYTATQAVCSAMNIPLPSNIPRNISDFTHYAADIAPPRAQK